MSVQSVLKRSLLLLLLLAPTFVFGQTLDVRLDGDQLRILAPQLKLLTKEAVDRLRNGGSIAYVFRISLTSDQNGAQLDQATTRCVFSYDLWEEKYAVARLDPSPRAISHLTAAAAETWCLNGLTIRNASVTGDRTFRLELNYEMEDRGPEEELDSSGLTLSGLVDIFSRRNPRQPINGSRRAGPMRLSDLRRR